MAEACSSWPFSSPPQVSAPRRTACRLHGVYWSSYSTVHFCHTILRTVLGHGLSIFVFQCALWAVQNFPSIRYCTWTTEVASVRSLFPFLLSAECGGVVIVHVRILGKYLFYLCLCSVRQKQAEETTRAHRVSLAVHFILFRARIASAIPC